MPPDGTAIVAKNKSRINPDGSEMRGDSLKNKQVELIVSDRWFQ